MPLTPALRTQWQEDLSELQASQGYTDTLPKKKKKNLNLILQTRWQLKL